MTDVNVCTIPDLTRTTELSLPEELQLALPAMSGQLRFGSMDIAVAALIDLAFRGRLVATRSRFGPSSNAKLTLVDASPTGNGPLDAVLQAFVERGKPWKIYPAVTALWAVVSEATTASLVARGALTTNGTMRDRGSHLEPLDLALREDLMARIDRAPSAEDPRATVLLDIRQHSAWGFTPKPGQRRPPVLADYPENVGITARGALSALYIASGSAV
ncbi:hypothetical protein E3T61_04605 [Cryobacterium lactosi]|uniref:GPP34 family phosphoprotein n=1 Tax=Cryobacterium lactosi TaxID=1259202 RepID=A0A4R9BY55_9MICO|nr:GPP34 family phosphoprotein [Cryobacterium lactosi]TFD93379.1 hypothetical protein E3T61_04605 [Cryobacterium lactosi]